MKAMTKGEERRLRIQEKHRKRSISEIAEAESLREAFQRTILDMALLEDPDEMYSNAIADVHRELVQDNGDYKKWSEQFSSAAQNTFKGLSADKKMSEASLTTLALYISRAVWQSSVSHPGSRKQMIKSSDEMYKMFKNTLPEI